MNRMRIFLLLLVFVVIFTHASVSAQSLDNSFFGAGAGIAGILDHHKLIFGSVQYRPNLEWFHLRPWVCAEFGYHMFFGAAGVLVHFNVNRHLIVTPSFGAGFYSSHRGIQLGSSIEFKSAMELGFFLKNNHMVGVSFSHLSNGGMDEKNPGAELLTFCYYVPI